MDLPIYMIVELLTIHGNSELNSGHKYVLKKKLAGFPRSLKTLDKGCTVYELLEQIILDIKNYEEPKFQEI